MTLVLVFSFCPRCDKAYAAETKEKANTLVRDHILRQEDELHENLLDEWDDIND